MSPEVGIVSALPQRPHLAKGRLEGARGAQQDHWLVRWSLITRAVMVIGFLVIVPLVNIFYEALAKGPQTYWDNLAKDPDTWDAITLTLRVAPTAVIANLI